MEDTLIWTTEKKTPVCGTDWEMFAEHIHDNDGNNVDSLYVIIVFIKHQFGGVFTGEPNSYYMRNDEVSYFLSLR